MHALPPSIDDVQNCLIVDQTYRCEIIDRALWANPFVELQARMARELPVIALDGRPYLQTRPYSGSGQTGYIQVDCLQ